LSDYFPIVSDRGAALADVDHGWEYNRQGKYGAALSNCDAALRLVPELGEAFLCLGWTHLAFGDATAALADFDRMARVKPAWWSPREGRAQSLLALGRFREATIALRDNFPMTASVATGNERGIAVLWMLTALRRSGESDQEAASIAGQTLDFDTWPGPIAAYLLRQRTAEEVEAAASVAVSFPQTAPSPACRSAFFLAEGDLADGFKEAARTRLQHAQAICPLNSGERMMAEIELKRLTP
jgi:tetratricopeptide (TPR) repeat protein